MIIDIASMRKEIYLSPGVLPQVCLGSFYEDINRRDFTINCLAISLNNKDMGTLVDITGGIDDINNGIVRVLHRRSFEDDPTRIIRGIKIASRYGYKFESKTKKLIKNAILSNVFYTVSKERLSNEMKLLFTEDSVHKALDMMNKFGGLSLLCPSIKVSPDIIATIKKLSVLVPVKNVPEFYEVINFDKELVILTALFIETLSTDLDKACNVFCLTTKIIAELHKMYNLHNDFLDMSNNYQNITDYQIYKNLGNYRLELIYAIFIYLSVKKIRNAKRIVKKYFEISKKAKIFICGDELKILGIQPGPVYKEIFEHITKLVIEGVIKNKEDEITHVKMYMNLREKHT